jgi:hypothetical protein
MLLGAHLLVHVSQEHGVVEASHHVTTHLSNLQHLAQTVQLACRVCSKREGGQHQET